MYQSWVTSLSVEEVAAKVSTAVSECQQFSTGPKKYPAASALIVHDVYTVFIRIFFVFILLIVLFMTAD